MASPAVPTVHGRAGTAAEPTYPQELVEVLRVILVAGIPTGIVVAGLGSRLAMFLLRLTSPPAVNGVTSDDGFLIGQFTLSGTYNLMTLGAAVGVIGAAAFIAVHPWLIGPQWFRRFTVAAASGAIVGSMLIHYDGVDFQLLGPLWFALSLFIALPALFGVAIGIAVDRVAAADSVTRRGARRGVLPLLLVVVVPQVLLIVTPVAMAVAALLPARRRFLGPLQASPAGTLVMRGVFLAIAVAGFVGLGSDVRMFTG